MSQEEVFINSELLRLRREARGWALSDLATRACMSVKQIRQLEEGGLSSFYSQAVKVTAAKKVGALLGVPEEEVFAQQAELNAVDEAVNSVELPHHEASVVDEKVVTEIEAVVAPVEVNPVDLTSTQLGHLESEKAETQPSEPAKAKGSLWVIAILFVAALAVAAYMQPKEEPVTEPAPPLQVVPNEADAAASAAEVSASAASAASAELVAPVVQKAASVSVSSASTPAATASVPRIAASSPTASVAKQGAVQSAVSAASSASALKTP